MANLRELSKAINVPPFGMFDIFIPLSYEEGRNNAMRRLLNKTHLQTGVHSRSSIWTNEDFVSREVILADLVKRIPPNASKT